MSLLLFKPRTANPYPDEYTLLFWHDLFKERVDAHGADWREQSAWVNRTIPEHRAFNPERHQKPWLAIRAAYEAKSVELEAALAKIKELEDECRAVAVTAS